MPRPGWPRLDGVGDGDDARGRDLSRLRSAWWRRRRPTWPWGASPVCAGVAAPSSRATIGPSRMPAASDSSTARLVASSTARRRARLRSGSGSRTPSWKPRTASASPATAPSAVENAAGAVDGAHGHLQLVGARSWRSPAAGSGRRSPAPRSPPSAPRTARRRRPSMADNRSRRPTRRRCSVRRRPRRSCS